MRFAATIKNERRRALKSRDKDPTRTITLRRRFSSEIGRRFGKLKGLVRRKIVTENFLEYEQVQTNVIQLAGFEYRNIEEKTEAFMRWLRRMNREEVLETVLRTDTAPQGREPWSNLYVRHGYQSGMQAARRDLISAGARMPRFDQSLFSGNTTTIGAAFNQPIHAERVATLYTRAFRDLEGVTVAMENRMAAVLAEQMIKGENPRRIATALNDRVSKIGITRGKLIARTEVVRAHNVGALSEYEAAEQIIDENVYSQWWTALDERVRASHAQRHGRVFTSARAMELIGEPNCRCSLLPWIPSVHGEVLNRSAASTYGWLPTGEIREAGRRESKEEIADRFGLTGEDRRKFLAGEDEEFIRPKASTLRDEAKKRARERLERVEDELRLWEGINREELLSVEEIDLNSSIYADIEAAKTIEELNHFTRRRFGYAYVNRSMYRIQELHGVGEQGAGLLDDAVAMQTAKRTGEVIDDLHARFPVLDRTVPDWEDVSRGDYLTISGEAADEFGAIANPVTGSYCGGWYWNTENHLQYAVRSSTKDFLKESRLLPGQKVISGPANNLNTILRHEYGHRVQARMQHLFVREGREEFGKRLARLDKTFDDIVLRQEIHDRITDNIKKQVSEWQLAGRKYTFEDIKELRNGLRSQYDHIIDFNAPNMLDVEKFISRYAASTKRSIVFGKKIYNQEEFFAECFAMFTHPEYGRYGVYLPREIHEMMEEILDIRVPYGRGEGFLRGTNLPMTAAEDFYACVFTSSISEIMNRRFLRVPEACLDYVREGKKWKYAGEEVADEVKERLEKMRIPPAWKNVVVAKSPKAKIQAIGQDAKGRWQYRYSEEHIKEAAAKKFKRVKSFSRDIDSIRKKVDDGVAAGDERALLLRLEDQTAIRAGSRRDVRADKKAYGLTTLLHEHVSIRGDKITLNFTAKKGVEATYEVRDSILADWLRELKSKSSIGDELFPGMTAKKLNDFLKELAGGKKYSLKDFRTLHGTRIAYTELKKYAGKKFTKKQKKEIVKEVSEKVADFLKNTPTISRQSYIDPMVWEIIGGLP